jgi:general secretion pathway protein K
VTGRPAELRQRGFALLIVLWSMGLLALIGTRITAAGRAETQLAGNLRAEAVAEAAADGAVFVGLFHYLDRSGAHWPADGQPRRIKLAQAVADVTLTDESRKIGLNNAPPPLLQGLLRALGVEPRLAAVLAGRIVDWRSPQEAPVPGGGKQVPVTATYRAAGRDWGPPARPFQGLDELSLVLGMTPDVLARLRPVVSPFVASVPKPEETSPVIAAALAQAAARGLQPLSFAGPPTLTITAVVAGDGGGRFARRAVLQVNPDGGPRPFLILDWEQIAG